MAFMGGISLDQGKLHDLHIVRTLRSEEIDARTEHIAGLIATLPGEAVVSLRQITFMQRVYFLPFKIVDFQDQRSLFPLVQVYHRSGFEGIGIGANHQLSSWEFFGYRAYRSQTDNSIDGSGDGKAVIKVIIEMNRCHTSAGGIADGDETDFQE